MAQKPSITLMLGDITTLEVDAIVNAANEHLQHGGGVAGAISRRGGPEIQRASNEWVAAHGRVVTGSAAITPAGQLKSKYVIHAVGPVMGSGNEDAKLRSATLASLRLAEEYHLASIALPAISTGIFGYPVERCAQVMLGAVLKYLSGPSGLQQVIFCLYDQHTLDIFTTIYNHKGSK